MMQNYKLFTLGQYYYKYWPREEDHCSSSFSAIVFKSTLDGEIGGVSCRYSRLGFAMSLFKKSSSSGSLIMGVEPAAGGASIILTEVPSSKCSSLIV